MADSPALTPQATRSTTLSDIARRAGVSLNTASRVLNGQVKGAYPKARLRAERIQRIADELGYRANTAARATASGRFGAVGLLFRDDGMPVGSSVVYGVNDVLKEQGLRLVLAPVHERAELEQDHPPSFFQELSVDGVLIHLMQDVPDRLIQTVGRQHRPVVYINAKLDHNAVRPDDQAIFVDMTRALLERGHKRIAFLGYTQQGTKHYSGADRRSGYARAMKDAGLTPVSHEGGRPHQGAQWLACARAILSEADRPTAVVCENDGLGHTLLYAACGQRLRVPEDLSIVSAIDHRRDVIGVEMGGVRLPFKQIGHDAARMLDRVIQAGEPQPSICLKAEFEANQTVSVRPSVS